jgi:thiol-disulfide isomerase/thioredoxin
MPPKSSLTLALIAFSLAVPGTAADSRKAAPVFPELARYKGKVVLLNFWATTCGGCLLEIPWLMEFEKKYEAGGFTVLGVALDEDGWKSVTPFARQRKLNYPVIIGNDAFAARYHVEAMPATFLIDRRGKITAEYSGLVDRDRCESEIRTLLKERPDPRRAPAP